MAKFYSFLQNTVHRASTFYSFLQNTVRKASRFYSQPFDGIDGSVALQVLG